MIEQAISRSKNIAFGMAAMPSMTLLFNVVIVIYRWLSRNRTARGLVPVVRLGVPLRCKACKLGDPLSYPLDNERTLVSY